MNYFVTADGSPTLRNIEYDEFYHSKSGAVEEAIEKYVKPCRIAQLEGHIRVLDIGFGLGYTAIAAIDAARGEIEVMSLEKNLVPEIRTLKPGLRNYGILSKLEFDPKTKSYLYEEKNIYLKIMMGDAKETIKRLSQKFDAVFHDPFSPSKNPELWTEDFFREISSRMKKGAILSTYSCAKAVRDNMKKAGLVVSDGPVVGRRGPSTIAKLP